MPHLREALDLLKRLPILRAAPETVCQHGCRMSEIKRPPVRIVVGDVEYDAFDENHSLADIARWIRCNEVDHEEIVRLLGAEFIEVGRS